MITNLDKLNEAIALSITRGNDFAHVLKAYGIEDAPDDIVYLIKLGATQYQKTRDTWARIEQKVLIIKPEFFKEVQQRIQEENNTPKGKRLARLAKHKEEEITQRRNKVYKEQEAFWNKVEQALALYENWKVGKIPLGEATREHLIKHSKRENLTSLAHEENSLFYAKLAAKLRPKQKVKDGISLEEAHAIREEVYKPAAVVKKAA